MITHQVPRPDAVTIGHALSARAYVPTTGETVWISSWEEFNACGGRLLWNEDQTELTLHLPEDHKFSIQFGRA